MTHASRRACASRSPPCIPPHPRDQTLLGFGLMSGAAEEGLNPSEPQVRVPALCQSGPCSTPNNPICSAQAPPNPTALKRGLACLQDSESRWGQAGEVVSQGETRRGTFLEALGKAGILGVVQVAASPGVGGQLMSRCVSGGSEVHMVAGATVFGPACSPFPSAIGGTCGRRAVQPGVRGLQIRN